MASQASDKWQELVSFLETQPGISQCAFICAKSGVVWGASAGFELLSYEATVIAEDGSDQVQHIDERSNLVQLMTSTHPPHQGLRIGQSPKIQILRSFIDPTEGVSNMVVFGRLPSGGCCLAATAEKSIVVGIYDETRNHQGTACHESGESIRDYIHILIFFSLFPPFPFLSFLFHSSHPFKAPH